MQSPTPTEISDLLESCGKTQEAVALLLHVNGRTVRQWKAGDRKMHPAFWELLNLKLKSDNPVVKHRPSPIAP